MNTSSTSYVNTSLPYKLFSSIPWLHYIQNTPNTRKTSSSISKRNSYWLQKYSALSVLHNYSFTEENIDMEDPNVRDGITESINSWNSSSFEPYHSCLPLCSMHWFPYATSMETMYETANY